MSHQFLHHFELSADTPKQRRIGVSESMPADALLNIEGLGNWSNIIAKDGCAPVRPPFFVQAARKDPVVRIRKLIGLSPGRQRISELRMERNRLLRGLRLAAADNTEDDRPGHTEFPMFEVNVTPLEPKQFTLPQAGRCGQKNERAFAKSEMVYQSSDFQGGKHNWSAPPLCALANKSNRVAVEQLIPARMIKQNGQDISDLRA